jgi:hypothetical protein
MIRGAMQCNHGDMESPWTPRLVIQEQGGHCRLRLANEAWGDGATFQEAADDLVARVMRHAVALRAGGFRYQRTRARRIRAGLTSSTRWATSGSAS